MSRHVDLIRYHLESAMELAVEDRSAMVRYFVGMALAENNETAGANPTDVASSEKGEAKNVVRAG